MSRTYEALRKAESERATPVALDKAEPVNGSASRLRVDCSDPAHLEYEKIRVWLRNPARPEERLQTVMVVTCHSGSGSTTTAALLAATLAEARNSRVLIIDSNFRTPGLNLVFRIEPHDNGHNGTEVPFEARIQPTDRPNLFVLTNPHPATLALDEFDEQALDDLITEARRRFNLVVFDAAPALDFPDAYALAPKVDGIILVAESEVTLIEDAQRAKRDLERAGGRLLGVVLNRHTNYLPEFLRRFVSST